MTLSDNRLHDLIRFYEILDMLAERIGGPRILAECTVRMGWPERGVYFFQEHGETLSDSGTGPRIVHPAQQLQQTCTRCPVVFLAWRPLQPGKGSHFRAMEPESCR